MKVEIGSDFWDYSIVNKECGKKITEIENYKNKFLLNTGRNSIKLCIQQIEKKSKNVLLPSYTCDTVIKPFLEQKFNVHYYDLNLDLTINMNTLWQKTIEINPDIVLFHGYFGFQTLINLEDYIKYAQEHDIKIIEDITHTLFSNIQRINSDFIVGSLRKWFAIPDGGVLLSHDKITTTKLEEDIETLDLMIRAFNIKKLYMNYRISDLKDLYLRLYRKANENLNSNVLYKMSDISQNIFRNCNIEDIKIKRKINFRFLCEQLRDINGIEIIFDKCNECNTPLYFPIYIIESEERKKLQAYLAKNNIYCPIIWPKPKEFYEDNYVANYIYDHIICIPCDQRYNIDDMNKIILNIKSYFSRNYEDII